MDHFTITDLVAEGDAVVARFTSEITLATGKKIDSRGLTYRDAPRPGRVGLPAVVAWLERPS